jgi:uncharacterized LabA/DUF88 family protein
MEKQTKALKKMSQSQKKEQNIAYVDGANLYQGSLALGWELDYQRFRVWLKEKYSVERAYLFIGLVPKFKDLYAFLQEIGYTLIFKEISRDGTGKVKGNCDSDLVLKGVVDYYEKNLNKAVLVSSDGDYASLVKFWKDRGSFYSLISPNEKCSFLLRKLNMPIVYLSSQRSNLEKTAEKEKAPDGDGTPQGSLS